MPVLTGGAAPGLVGSRPVQTGSELEWVVALSYTRAGRVSIARL